MAKEKLYHVKRNDSWHSYEFLAQRQNDPKWRQAFLEAEALREQEDKKRKRRNFIILIVSVPVLLIAVMVGLYFYGSSGEEVIPKREVTLNNSTTISTEETDESETMDTASVGQVLTTPWGEQVTVLRILSNGERVIKEGYSPSDLNGDGLLTFEELSKVEEEANRGGNQQPYQQQPQQGQNNQQQHSPQQGQYNQQQQTPQQEQNQQQPIPQENQQDVQPSQSNAHQTPQSQEAPTQNQQGTPQGQQSR